MIMKNRITITAMTFILVSCDVASVSGLPDSGESTNPLSIAGVEIASTRAPYTDGKLKGDFGIMLIGKGSPDSYDGKDYANVRFTSDGVSDCTTKDEVLLSGTEGTLYSYYPYSETVTDLKSIAVGITEDDCTDYMYGTPVTGLDNSNASALITMNHALAAINLSIVRGTYSGTGIISKIAVSGEAIASKAILDATTGRLSGFAGTGSEIRLKLNGSSEETLSDDVMEKYFIIIPTGESKPFDVTLTIDGVDFTATAPEVDLAEGTITKYTATVNSKDFGIACGYVTPWETVMHQYYDFELYQF